MPNLVNARRACSALALVAGFVGLTALSAGSAAAQPVSRVDASRLTCGALQDVLFDRGAAIVRSRSRVSGRQLWERYVSNRRYCFANEVTVYRDVNTVDTPYCSVLLCTERERRRFKSH